MTKGKEFTEDQHTGSELHRMRRLHRGNPVRLLIALLASGIALVGLVACDSGPEETNSNIDPENIYFHPIKIGETAVFEYQSVDSNPYFGIAFESQGIMEWTVVDTTTVEGFPAIIIDEKIRGYSLEAGPFGQMQRDTIITDVARHAILRDDRLDFSPYTDYLPSWHWAYPTGTPDTVAFDIYLGGTYEYSSRKQAKIVKDTGLLTWYSGKTGVIQDWYLVSRVFP
jgi:hypothetical protein